MGTINEIFQELCKKKSDINEHLPALQKYSTECKHITEFGVRNCVSTWAFLAGKPLKLVSYDIYRSAQIVFVCEKTKEAQIIFDFKQENTLETEIEETELLFIDTLHTYQQLYTELFKHGNKSSKYIIMHDTTAHEIIDGHMNGHSEAHHPAICKTGLWQAILEFIYAYPEWIIKEKFENCQGLTILKRKKVALSDDIIKKGLTMVSEERFFTIDHIKNIIYNEKIQGDIVETGVWKGGMSIYLASQFPDKDIWVCDSFEGCQDDSLGHFPYNGERHTLGMMKISLEEVQNNFRDFNLLNETRIHFLKGWFRDTIDNINCPIKQIALLRFDGDSYSATLEVLNGLYNKVVPGGFIIIDDSCFKNVMEAVELYRKKFNLKFVYKNPIDLSIIDSFPVSERDNYQLTVPPGVWFRKE